MDDLSRANVSGDLTPRRRRSAPALLLSLLAAGPLLLTACGGEAPTHPLRVGSTTSLYDTGLLDDLLPSFEQAYPGYAVQVVAVGTGEALELGRRRDVDLVLVHAPEREAQFIQEGYGLERLPFLRNDFVIAGPADDPAGISATGSAVEAFRRIADTGSRFLSRGDDSGTHIREKTLWKEAGIDPSGDWYEQAGQGMAATLQVADERSAYVLTDRATLVSLAGTVSLIPLVADDPLLRNVYSAIPVREATESMGACLFANWLRLPSTAARVRSFGEDTFGSALFTPLPPDSTSGAPTTAAAVASACAASRDGLNGKAPRSQRMAGLDPFSQAWKLLVGGDPYVREIVLRSLAISGSALVLAAAVALPLGMLVALGRFRLRLPVVAVLNTGLALPPVVVGLAVYLLLSHDGPLGSLRILYTPAAIVIAQAILAGPYIAAVTLAAVEAVPPDVRLQARGLGASRTRALFLHLREARASLVAAVAAGFGATLSEVGAVMIVGGNLLGRTRVMTTAIVLETRRGHFEVAIALGVVLLGIALVVNVGLAALGARGAVGARGPRRPQTS